MEAPGMMALCSCLTAALAPGRKRVLKVPRACFANRGVDPGDIDVPFGITADAPFAAASTNIRVVAGAAAEAEAFDCGAVAY